MKVDFKKHRNEMPGRAWGGVGEVFYGPGEERGDVVRLRKQGKKESCVF